MTALACVAREPRALIAERLDEIEHAYDVRLLFAVESGSRAWGFPSPDSDYDVRFVYAHPADWYLSVDAQRDVIELPIEGEMDINGWELRKALNLLIKPNPVLLEWLRSPIVYRADGEAMVKLLDLAEKTAHQRPCGHHYLQLCRNQYRRFIEGQERVKLKKYFYALRPAVALMWLRTNPGRPLPMNLGELRAGLDLPAGLSTFLDEMLARKALTREMGEGPRLVMLDALIEEEIARAERVLPDAEAPSADLHREANCLFRDLVLGR
ncbi:nucleotidyltransferase domain-containing protein [Pelagibius litoralis]|uniref:Nucleotidyltransferase domain-containing protein n=1 Tax=Pelagibius litoralis TaxID=374515 RepID=A0A967C2G7_9PROT|nr:nucleotidyltransferase domain-containing protein [Pelagibius litoralis]NIA68348.1 nucleotidyltransferase domain-containing protein [Pelagibius litoralis]